MKKILLSAIAILFCTSLFAQTNGSNSSPYGTGKDSIECRRNIAFFLTYLKSNNYPDAYNFWSKAYKACPSSTKDIYIAGAKILNWKIRNAANAAESETFLKELMHLYDDRIKYFGDDPNRGVDYILGSKASDYIAVMQDKADYNLVYGWLKDIVAEKKEQTDPLALSMYAYSSMGKMMKDPSHKAKYVEDYLTVTGYFDKMAEAATAAGDEAGANSYKQYRAGADGNFAASGAADCKMLATIYGPQMDANKSNKEFLQNVVVLLHRINCKESPLYYQAADYLYAIEPSVDAALGLGRAAFVKKDYGRATKFFEEAIKLSQDSKQKGEIYYNMAAMAYEQRNYARARQYCNLAMQERPGYGAPMLLIAQMYAATAGSIYPDDPIFTRVVYCLVVDKCERAKAIDPSVSDDANKLIATYRKHFPSKEDVFMHPKLDEGASFTVGGWIGENTTVRTK